MISDDRQKHFAHLLIDELWGDEYIDFDEDSEENIIREAKRLIAEWVKEQGDIDGEVRKKINSLQRNIPEGTSEWKIMYNKYFADEMARRGHK